MFSGNFPEPFIVFRTIGAPAGERFGVGVMDKSGLSSDYTNRAHPGYVLVLLLRGRGVYRTAEGDAFALEPGSVFQRFRGVPHTTEVDPSSNWLECFIELGESVAALLANYALADPAEPVRRISPVSSLVDRFTGLGESFRTASDAELLRQLPSIVELAMLCLGGKEEPAPAGRPRRPIEAAGAGERRGRPTPRGLRAARPRLPPTGRPRGVLPPKRLRLRELPQTVQSGTRHLAAPLPDPAQARCGLRASDPAGAVDRRDRRTARLRVAV